MMKNFIHRLVRPSYGIIHVLLFAVVCVVIVRVSMVNYMTKVTLAVTESPLSDVRIAVVEGHNQTVSEAYQHDYEFTKDWFTGNISVWKKALAPFKGKPDIQYLEIGAYEGMSLLWALENIFTDPSARLTAVDIFAGPYKDRYFRNVDRSGASQKITSITGYSQIVLRKLPLNAFDVIYIDGSHDKDDVLEDAVLSARLLKKGGILIFDDYRWGGFNVSGTSDKPTDFPKPAIDRFALSFDDDFEVTHNWTQLILRKRP